MKNRIVIIGANKHQNPLIDEVKKLGYETHVFAWQTGDIGENTADFFYPISITSIDEIINECRRIQPCAVLSIASDLSAITSAKIAAEFDLVYNTEEAVKIATNKRYMRNALAKAGVLQPRFSQIDDSMSAYELEYINYPVVVKPSDRSGGRGVVKANNYMKMLQALSMARDISFERKAIVEEYINGRYVSCECISYNGKHQLVALTKRNTIEINNTFFEYSHEQPANENNEILTKLEKLSYKILDVVGITNGASDIEFCIDAKGDCYLIDISPTMYGDYVGTHLTYLSKENNYMKMMIDVALGKEPQAIKNDTVKNVIARFVFSRIDFKRYLYNKEKILFTDISSEINEEDLSDNKQMERVGCYITKKDERKKLLILGANAETAKLVEIAKKKNIYTIVTDYMPGAYAKQFADKSYDIDGVDVESLVDMAIKEDVDGVLVGTADPLIPAYQRVCESLNLPCYATKEQVDCFTDKYNFKRKCEKYGIKGIPEYVINMDNENLLDENNRIIDADTNNIPFPVLIKPVDACSGKGMTVCYHFSELKEAIKKALLASRRKMYIVEKYMECDDLLLYYTIKDGKTYLSAIADRYTTKEQKGADPVVVGGVYPSKYLNLYMDTMHERVCRMFKDMNLNNGVMLFQAFVENDNIYVYDPGFRLQGAAPHLLLAAINGFDHREMLIEYALTGSMGNIDMDKANDYLMKGKCAASLVFLLKCGRVARIEGMEYIESCPDVIACTQRLFEGDEVYARGTEQQVLTRLHIVSNSKAEYKEIVDDIKKHLKVYDTEGNNMLLEGFDSNVLLS